MKQPNDERYRKLLESTLPTYNKEEEWRAIAEQLPPERRRAAWLWWWLAGATILLAAVLWLQPDAPKLNAFPIPGTAAPALAKHPEPEQETGYDGAPTVNESEKRLPAREMKLRSATHPYAPRINRKNLFVAPLPSRIPLLCDKLTALKAPVNLLRPIEPLSIGLLPSPTPLLPPFEALEQPKKKPSLHLQSGFGVLSQKTTAEAAQADYIDALEAREAPLYQSHVQLNYRQPIFQDWSFEVGIAYLQLITRYRFQETETEVDEVPSDSASFFTFPDGLTEYYPGELEQTTITERRVQQFNQFHQLGLSAGLRWQPTLFRKVPTFVKVHYAYYPLRWAEGRSLTPSLGYAPFEDPELESTLPKQFSMLNLQAGTAWQLSASLQLEAGIFYQRTLSNASAVPGVKLRYQSWGGLLGLSWKL